MAETRKKLPDNPKDSLGASIIYLENAYLKWYERSVSRNQYFYHIIQVIALVSGFGTALVAALLKDEQFRGFSAGRIVLVVLPLIGSLCATVLAQSRVYERWRLRENGRLAIQALSNEGRQRYAEAKTPEEYTQIHKELNAKVDEIEKSQSAGYFSHVPSFVQGGGTGGNDR